MCLHQFDLFEISSARDLIVLCSENLGKLAGESSQHLEQRVAWLGELNTELDMAKIGHILLHGEERPELSGLTATAAAECSPY
jgi:hypothetical protein